MRPKTMQVQAFVTYRCNQACGDYCPFSALAQKVEELSIAKLMQIFYVLCKKLGIRHFALIGGEPLIKEGILALLHFFATQLEEAEVLLVTNGIELDRNPELRAGLVATRPPKIVISFDGPNANPKSVLGLQALQKMRAEYPKTEFWFAANCMVNKVNIDILPTIFAILAKEGIRLNLCIEQTECFEKPSPTALTAEDLPIVTEMSEWLVETKRQSDLLIPSEKFLAALPNFVVGKGLHECRKTFPRTLHISPDGGMPTCEWHKRGGLERIFNAKFLVQFPHILFLWEIAWKLLSLSEKCRCSWSFIDRVLQKGHNTCYS